MDKLTMGLIIAFGAVALITGALAFIVVRNLVNSWTMTDLPGAPQGSGAATVSPDQIDISGLPETPLQEAAGPTPVPWDGASRVNILVMGLDYRDWESGETPRTDTMILFTIDPLTKTAGMLSIPRDMWVNIPGFNYAKINTAYYLGDIYDVPGGGPALAMQTVEEFLGVPIQYYAQIDFYAFVRIIDELGGLDIRIYDPIKVGLLGVPDGDVYLEPGVQNLDGLTVLGYARARYTEGGDFDRAKRQQQVIMAVRDQILTFNMLPTLVAKAPALYQDISSGINTNLSLQQAMQLGILALQIPEGNIKQGVIGPPDQVTLGTSPDGLSIAIPVYDAIRLLRDDIFTTSGSTTPLAAQVTGNSDPVALMQAENARISLQNGTLTSGLATQTSEYFRSQGLNVVEETNADRVYEATTFIVTNGKPYTVKYLSELMGVQGGNIYNKFDPNASSDVVVILGNDWAAKNVLPQ
ncbi:MAG: LCP family protein [Chloroflexi bacterium]|jgi:LCP family protein required for cell wall assembly|nr:LCP family protein [Chloroflexota bacterium]